MLFGTKFLSDRGLKIAFDTKRTLAELISVAKEYPEISAAKCSFTIRNDLFAVLSYTKKV